MIRDEDDLLLCFELVGPCYGYKGASKKFILYVRCLERKQNTHPVPFLSTPEPTICKQRLVDPSPSSSRLSARVIT